MRLFQCSYPTIDMMDWCRDDEKYKVTYHDRLAKADNAARDREIMLDILKVPYPDKKGAAITGLILTERQITDCLLLGEVPKIERTIAIEDSLEGELIKFRSVVDKLHAIPAVERTYNGRVEVHMPGQALSLYNDTLLLENSCSDDLQKALEDGWRMIAACPQPDQRRPDYILGRYNPLKEADGNGAKRRV